MGSPSWVQPTELRHGGLPEYACPGVIFLLVTDFPGS